MSDSFHRSLDAARERAGFAHTLGSGVEEYTAKAAAGERAGEHNHAGPDWQCEACKPLAEVLRRRMTWPSLHWGNLHADAFPSLARAVHESPEFIHLIAEAERRGAERALRDVRVEVLRAAQIGGES